MEPRDYTVVVRDEDGDHVSIVLNGYTDSEIAEFGDVAVLSVVKEAFIDFTIDRPYQRNNIKTLAKQNFLLSYVVRWWWTASDQPTEPADD
jgi:hypothetical protein